MTNGLDLFDAIAGTTVVSRVSTSGHAWSLPSGGTSPIISPSGECYSGVSFTVRCYLTGAVPASADYIVRGKLKQLTALTGVNAGICGRSDIDASLDGYYLRYIQTLFSGAGGWRVDKIVAGTTTSLGSVQATLTNGQTYQLELSMIGSVITGKVDGATIWTGTDASPITGAGISGMIFGGAASTATTGLHMLDYEQEDYAVSNAGPDQTDVIPYSTVTLTGTGVGSWSQTGGSPTVTLSGSGLVRTFEAPPTVNGTTLTFTFGTDTMTVQIDPWTVWGRDPGNPGTPRPLRINSRT